ncbi:cupin-like domain-containing protein [Mycobacterium sp. MMS18-G62]
MISGGQSPRAAVLDAPFRRVSRVAPHELPRIDLARWMEIGERARHEAVPLVIAGAVAESTAVREWSPRGLATRFDTTVPAALDLPGGRAPYMDAEAAHGAQIPFSELIDRIERGERCYLAQASLERFDGLEDELDLSALIAVPRYGVNLWVGGQTRSGLHFDSADNVLVQIYGRKRAVLVAPKHVRALRVLRDVPSKSSLSPDEIESEDDGPLSLVERWRTTLDPGDALYIPRGWWHYLASPGASISVNHWHGDHLSAKDHITAFVLAGPRVWSRTARDFLWCGVLGRPHRQRLFSPPSLGMDLHRRLIRRSR